MNFDMFLIILAMTTTLMWAIPTKRSSKKMILAMITGNITTISRHMTRMAMKNCSNLTAPSDVLSNLIII